MCSSWFELSTVPRCLTFLDSCIASSLRITWAPERFSGAVASFVLALMLETKSLPFLSTVIYLYNTLFYMSYSEAHLKLKPLILTSTPFLKMFLNRIFGSRGKELTMQATELLKATGVPQLAYCPKPPSAFHTHVKVELEPPERTTICCIKSYREFWFYVRYL